MANRAPVHFDRKSPRSRLIKDWNQDAAETTNRDDVCAELRALMSPWRSVVRDASGMLAHLNRSVRVHQEADFREAPSRVRPPYLVGRSLTASAGAHQPHTDLDSARGQVRRIREPWSENNFTPTQILGYSSDLSEDPMDEPFSANQFAEPTPELSIALASGAAPRRSRCITY